MSKVLLKHAAVKSSKKYQADVARMVNITIAVQASSTPTIEMISVRELHAREDNSTIHNETPETERICLKK